MSCVGANTSCHTMRMRCPTFNTTDLLLHYVQTLPSIGKLHADEWHKSPCVIMSVQGRVGKTALGLPDVESVCLSKSHGCQIWQPQCRLRAM